MPPPIPPTARPRQAGWILAVVTTALVVGILGPALGLGYVLSYDMVFVPRQSFLPEFFGLGGGLPRAVPQDSVVTVLTQLAPGWLWQHVALIGAIGLAASGAAMLLRGRPTWVRCTAAIFAVWNPWFVERLYQGHWGLLLGYAALPWAIGAACGVRRGDPGALARWLLWLALGSLVATSGLLVLATTLPIAMVRAPGVARRTKVLATLGGAALQLTWLVPALINPALGTADGGGVAVFGIRSEGAWGSWITALGLGGIWNGDVVLGTRGSVLALVGTVFVVALSVAGWRSYVRLLGRASAYSLALAASAGLVFACLAATAYGQSVLLWTVDHVAGAGLLRDTHKFLAPLALLLALAASLGAARLITPLRDPAVRGILIAAALLIPFVVMPDAVWGGTGRLDSVQYPSDWDTVRTLLAQDPTPGDVAALPWSSFRAFAWNARRTQLDPAPRWMPRTTVTDDTLLVARGSTIVSIAGEDPRSRVISAAIADSKPLAPVLGALGVRWVLQEYGTPAGGVRPDLTGLSQVYRGSDLGLLEVPNAAAPEGPATWRVAAVALVDGLALAIVIGSVLRVAALSLLRWSARRQSNT